MPAAKVIAVVAAAALGALAAAGCALAALFEIQGFGTPRDAQPRLSLIAVYGLGLLASVLIPLGLWSRLLPSSAPAARWLALTAAVLAVVALLGIVAAS